MAKRKLKKTKKIADPVIEEKRCQLNNLKELVHVSFSEYETSMLMLMEEKIGKIKKLYEDKLRSIPDNVKQMTITQLIEHQDKENCVIDSAQKDDIRAVIEKSKMLSEKKRTLKKEKKRSLSVNTSTRPLAIPRQPTNTFSRMSRATSDPVLNTPLRSNRMSNMVVTPKFNPKFPVSTMARIPKPDELVMSLSGSPLQNVFTEGKVTLSFGGKKVLQLNEDTDLEKELKADIDEPLKKTFKNLREQIDKILKA